MGKILLGSMLLVLGLFASFIPPFIWGAPLFVVGIMTLMAGFATTTVSAAKTVVAVSKELSRSSTDRYEAPRVERQASPSKDYDVQKWESLKEFDDDIRAAAQRLAAFGPAMEDKLAKAYLAISDKAYLQTIVSKLETEARA